MGRTNGLTVAEMSDDVDFNWESGKSPEELAAKFGELDDVVEDKLEDAMTRVVAKIEADAKRNAPVDTSNLRGSIQGIALGWIGNVLEGVVGTNVEYAEFVEEGTDSHTITGDPLHFKVGGEDVFATSVQHPGTDPNPFLEPAVENNRDWAYDQYEEAIEEAVDEVF